MATKITQIKNKSNDNRLPAFFVYSLKSAIFAVGYELNKNKKKKQWQWKLKPYRP